MKGTPRARRVAPVRPTAEAALRVLHDIAAAASGVMEPRALARVVAQHATDLLGADAVALYLWDEEAALLRPLYANDPRMTTPVAPLEAGQGIAGRALNNREAVVVNDYSTWGSALPAASANGLRAAMAVPLMASNRPVGALVVRSYTPRAYTRQEQNLLSLLAAQVASTLEAARLYTAAERLAHEAAERAAELAASERRLRSLVGSSLDVIAVLDERGTASFVSQSVELLWGYATHQVELRSAFEHVHAEDVANCQATLARAIEQPDKTHVTELRLQHADGSWRDFELIVKNQLADPAIAGVVATYHDVTERKSFESDLRYLALHDPLLDMPNRALFMERLEHALTEAERRGCQVGVLFIDLDKFKLINDTLGHAAGDQLLMTVAERIRDCVRGNDSTGRLGGDEFTVLLESIDSVQDAIRVANRLIDRLAEPVDLDGHVVVPSASIGVALSTPDRHQADALLRAADLAMYKAKSSGKGRYELFDRSMDSEAMERLELEGDLRHALEAGEFRVYYQPLVALDSGRICGAEALVRWLHPRHGFIPPHEFVSLAEQTGLIVPIGQWVLEEACRMAHAWQAQLPQGVPFTLNVNLSSKQLQQRDLVDSVARVLRQSGLHSGSLTLEVTETVAMEDSECTRTNLRELRKLGVHVAMDDFGMGYSSLSYLNRFPVDGVKIDRSFVERLGQEEDETAIVRAILALANALNLTVTAEGIETSEQLADLRTLGCERGQGYFFARPLPSESFTELLGIASPPGDPANSRTRAA